MKELSRIFLVLSRMLGWGRGKMEQQKGRNVKKRKETAGGEKVEGKSRR